MSKSPATAPQSSAPSLQDLRKEIDRIDEAMHGLLMERGEIIDRLISVKKTQEVGSAFRPAREADMMRRLVERHKGMLPLDTVESIWRVIISTFTYVQAPFSMHADLSAGDSAMRDSARFHFGFSVPFVPHFSAVAAVEALAKAKGDLALVSATDSRSAWWTALEPANAPKIIARLPFLERADHPAALPVFVISRVADDAMVTEVEMFSIRVSGWSADVARADLAARRDRRGAGHRLRRGRPARLDQDQGRPGTAEVGADQGRRLGALDSPRRQPREPLYRDAERRTTACLTALFQDCTTRS